MTCEEITLLLDKQSPRKYAMAWDNVGLLVGRKNMPVKKVLLALDATSEVCDYAIDNRYDMIITHHPMIFSKINRINDDSVLGDKLLSLIENRICCYAMHTNFDTIGGMAKLAASKIGILESVVLEETEDGEGIGQIGKLQDAMTLKELALKVKETFGLKSVAVFGDENKNITRVAISPGSGKSEIEHAVSKGANCLITGDIGHHEGIDAVDMGLSIIDASHYGLEKIFMEYIKEYLEANCDNIDIDVLDVGVPFNVI